MAATAAKGGGAGGLMTPAELKPLLHLAKRQPMNCAIAMSKDKTGLILMHRRTKPKKLLAELKAQAKAKGIELDTTSLRFGRVSVDGASDAGMATFTVNKPAPGPMRRAMLEQVRPAGLQRCEIVVDASLEDETDEDGAEHGEAGPASAIGTAAAAHGSAASVAKGGQVPGDAIGLGHAVPSREDAAPGANGSANGQGGAGQPGSAPAASVRERLASLGLRAKDAIASGSPQADGIRAAAARARDALAAGDADTAGQAADAMEGLLGAGRPGPAARGRAQEGHGNPATGAGAPPGLRPDRAAALKADLLGLARRILGADPAERRKLVRLGNAAQAALAAGNLEEATAGIEALRRALPAKGGAGTGGTAASPTNAGSPSAKPPVAEAAPNQPPHGAGRPGFAAALRAGFDGRAGAARDRTGWTQAAEAAPGDQATDAAPAQAPVPPVAPVPAPGAHAPRGAATPPPGNRTGDAQPAPGGFMATARSYVGSLGTNVVGGFLGTPSALAHGLDWVGHKAGMDWGLQDRLHGVPDPSHPDRPLFPTPAEAHQMAYNTTGVQEYVPETRLGRVVQGGLEAALSGGAGSLATAPLRMAGRAGVSGVVRGAAGSAAAGGVGGTAGQVAYEAAPDGYGEVAAVVAGTVAGGAASRPRSRLAPGGRGSGTRPAATQGPVAQGTEPRPPPPITMRGAENPRPPPAGLTAAYSPAMGNVPQAAVTGTTRLDLSGRPPAGGAPPQGPARLPSPQDPLPSPLPLPTEQQLQALPGHGHSSHGAQTTLAQQETRLRTKIAPDGRRAPTNTATRFADHEAELDAVNQATALLQARDAAGLVSHAMPAPPSGPRAARLARVEIVVTGYPGGYGSGVTAQGRGAGRTVAPTGQYANALVVFDRDPLTGVWRTVTQYPTDLPVSPPP